MIVSNGKNKGDRARSNRLVVLLKPTLGCVPADMNTGMIVQKSTSAQPYRSNIHEYIFIYIERTSNQLTPLPPFHLWVFKRRTQGGLSPTEGNKNSRMVTPFPPKEAKKRRTSVPWGRYDVGGPPAAEPKQSETANPPPPPRPFTPKAKHPLLNGHHTRMLMHTWFGRTQEKMLIPSASPKAHSSCLQQRRETNVRTLGETIGASRAAAHYKR